MVSVSVDPAHGGRWTSLVSGGREWLWSRPSPARFAVAPGDTFVDVGGVEECLPTVRGVPDHGDVWSRPWTALPGEARVSAPDFALRRTIRTDGDAVHVGYTLRAAPGFRFVWAAHALLDVSASARLAAPAGTPTLVDGAGVVAWPAGGLDRLGPDDGTAVGAVLRDCPAVTVDDGERLSFTLHAPDQPVSVALWRNLGGWPEGDPYRSIGVEPMLGRVFDLAEAGPGDAAVVFGSGVARWMLTIS
ncbi:hypothetical protein [Cryptosporangium phraense]|uniref:Uncharacterized protein n=1 Tax=Cryptosporangium phraense TaxID=2593070 RepID=A0A545ATW1_9ACTN|nr:hypothetical protein [Cryptosporangium phraense]TQS44743.1 hypothetical protein FL583_12310 [Cryptosporangium phraense]